MDTYPTDLNRGGGWGGAAVEETEPWTRGPHFKGAGEWE
jgi:hypothetical protein